MKSSFVVPSFRIIELKLRKLFTQRRIWLPTCPPCFSYKEFQFKKICPPLKTSCTPVENINENPESWYFYSPSWTGYLFWWIQLCQFLAGMTHRRNWLFLSPATITVHVPFCPSLELSHSQLSFSLPFHHTQHHTHTQLDHPLMLSEFQSVSVYIAWKKMLC